MNGALNTSVISGTGKTYRPTVLPPDFNRLSDTQRTVEAGRKYADAVSLYASTDMPLCRVAEICGVTPAGLSAHIGRYHRSILYARYGLSAETSKLNDLKVKAPKGQSLKTHLKYKDAIEACGDIAYIEYNVSQIARMFGLDGTALASQLRVHYPSVIPARERMRSQLGIADNTHRGARHSSELAYEEALTLYQNSQLTISEVAERCNVSRGGLVQFMRFYHKDIIESRAAGRSEACGNTGFDRSGQMSGNGRPYGPRPDTIALYAPALELYRNSSKTVREIVEETGVPPEGFRAYLNKWHSGERQIRRGFSWDGTGEPDLKGTRRFLKSTREKYAQAIALLKAQNRPVAEVAAEFCLNPDVFREYLRTHEPQLASGLGMIRLTDGRRVKKNSYEKYRPAIEEYATSSEPLRSIAERHGLNYKSLSGFVKRNCPDEQERHRKILESNSQTILNETNRNNGNVTIKL